MNDDNLTGVDTETDTPVVKVPLKDKMAKVKAWPSRAKEWIKDKAEESADAIMKRLMFIDEEFVMNIGIIMIFLILSAFVGYGAFAMIASMF